MYEQPAEYVRTAVSTDAESLVSLGIVLYTLRRKTTLISDRFSFGYV